MTANSRYISRIILYSLSKPELTPAVSTTPEPPAASSQSLEILLLNDTSIAASSFHGEHRLFFQDRSGIIRQAIYSASTGRWSSDHRYVVASDAKNHTPIAVVNITSSLRVLSPYYAEKVSKPFTIGRFQGPSELNLSRSSSSIYSPITPLLARSLERAYGLGVVSHNLVNLLPRKIPDSYQSQWFQTIQTIRRFWYTKILITRSKWY